MPLRPEKASSVSPVPLSHPFPSPPRLVHVWPYGNGWEDNAPYFPVGVSATIGKTPWIDAPLGKNFACLPSLTLTQSLGYQGS